MNRPGAGQLNRGRVNGDARDDGIGGAGDGREGEQAEQTGEWLAGRHRVQDLVRARWDRQAGSGLATHESSRDGPRKQASDKFSCGMNGCSVMLSREEFVSF